MSQSISGDTGRHSRLASSALLLILLSVLLILATSCGSGADKAAKSDKDPKAKSAAHDTSEQPKHSTKAEPEEKPEHKSEPPTPSPGADGPEPMPNIDACKMAPTEEVAELAGGKALTEPKESGPTCMYVLEVPGDTESYNLAFTPESIQRELLKVQSHEERGKKVAGPWDEAYLGKRSAGDGARIVAFRSGKPAIEASGNREEVVLGIAKMAAENSAE